MIEEVKEGESRLVVLVRRDLPWNVRCVQSAHAVANWTRQNEMSAEVWGKYGPAFVLYGVKGAEELEQWVKELKGSVLFREPDLGEEATALAYYGRERLEGLYLL